MKRIISILMLLVIIVIMALPAMAWDGYPDTPIYSDKYDSSYIYQAIIYDSGSSYKTMLVVSQTPFYLIANPYSTRIRSSSKLYVLKYDNGNWLYWMSPGSTQGIAFEDILQSTHDIYTDSSLTSVFFSATRKTPMQETLTQHPPLTLMTPLIRGISPYLIGLLIVLAGFLKGLQLLFKTLHKA
ncbi:MAG: hypothetical protein GYA87_06925 [Christensenellaceae bacterium]|nr:hypothetical protein [Christensenellaceae bacterium]